MHEHVEGCVRAGADGAIRLTCVSPARLLVGSATSAYATRQARDAIDPSDPDYGVMTFALSLVIARGVKSAAISVGDIVRSSLRGDRGREWTVTSIDGDDRKVATLRTDDPLGMAPQQTRRFVSDLIRVRTGESR